MRKITEILRLRHEIGLSYRAISKTLNIGYGTVVEYLKKADKVGLKWPLPNNMDEHALSLLFFPSQKVTGQRRFVEPDYPNAHQELKRKGVTKHLLWQEYRELYPSDGYSYAQFCHRYLEWLGYQKSAVCAKFTSRAKSYSLTTVARRWMS